MRPLVAFVSFYRDGAKVLETEPVGVSDGWDPNPGPCRFVSPSPLAALQPGPYDCQVTVLDPSGNRAAFWRAPIVVIR